MKAKDKENLRKWILACLTVTAGILLGAYALCLPRDLFKGTAYSAVLRDRHGELLGARIADDGQWRFPPSDTVPEKFCTAVTEFEDRWFRYHPGINPVSLVKAAFRNIRAGHVVSGGSTITMQVIRLSRGRDRTLWQKAIECILATRLELRCSKDEILALYAAHAPFGGNTVGLEAASWRYFGKPSSELSWGEAATLAVLPNAPSMVHPGKNRDLLRKKRDRLLARLLEKEKIDSSTFVLACSEPLPDAPVPLPQYAPHLLDRMISEGDGPNTSIDISLQKRTADVLERWGKELSAKGIHDLAAIVYDVRTLQVLAYCGNTGYSSGRNGSQVDILRSPRSTGSILKPLLYCAMLQEGMILPGTILPDIPVNINGFSPQNFDRQFYGAVPAADALARSLNVPAVHQLRKYGVPKFLELLKETGMTTLTRPADVYGLSLILGGAECTSEEITRAYAMMAHILAYGDSVPEDSPIKDMEDSLLKALDDFPLKDRDAIWWTMEALKEVNRPDEMDWKSVPSLRKTAWKTGTSFGFRDAWAIGATPEYAVGVWAGNAGGEGVPGLTGASTAGPVMFDIFNLLPATGWFAEPVYGEYAEAEVCRMSGCLKGPYCPEADTLRLPKAALRSQACPYHRPVTLTSDGRFRTGASDPEAMTVNMFILPPAMEWYYRRQHPEYRPLPPLRPGTAAGEGYLPMEFIWPENGSTVTIPRQLDGSRKGFVCNLAHSNPSEEVYWHLDGSYIGSTRYIHQMTMMPKKGEHVVTVTDQDGNTLSVKIHVN